LLKLFVALAIGGLVAAAGAEAKEAVRAEPATAAQFKACMDKSGGVTLDMHNCLAAEDQRQDERLNANYKLLLSKLPTDQHDALRKAQRAWVAYRDSECALQGTFEHGNMGPLVIDGCYMDMTSRRADELKAYTAQAIDGY
jgi:uncharacterized protein YecT (DUF1311 family)